MTKFKTCEELVLDCLYKAQSENLRLEKQNEELFEFQKKYFGLYLLIKDNLVKNENKNVYKLIFDDEDDLTTFKELIEGDWK